MRTHIPSLSTPVAETNSNPLAGNVTCTDGTMDRTDPSFATVTMYETAPALSGTGPDNRTAKSPVIDEQSIRGDTSGATLST